MFGKKEPTVEEKHPRLVLRYSDLRAFMKGLKLSLSEEHKEALDEMLEQTAMHTRTDDELEKEVRELELKISEIEHFLLSFRDAQTQNRRPTITRVLEQSQNHAIAAAALGTDPQK